MRNADRFAVVATSLVIGFLGGVGGRWLGSMALGRAVEELWDEVDALKDRLRTRNARGATDARMTKQEVEANLLAHLTGLAGTDGTPQRRRRAPRMPGRLQSQDEAHVEPADAGEGDPEQE